MLGKLFGLRKKPAVATPTTPATPSDKPIPQEKKLRATPQQTLQTLAGVNSIDDITDSETLHQLLKNSAQLDKKTNRLLREKLQAIKNSEQQKQQTRDAQEKLCVKLETLAKLQHHPLFASELAHLQQQWQALAPQGEAFATRAQQAIQHCQATLATAIAEKERQIAQKLAAQQQAEAQQRQKAEQAQQQAEAEAQRLAEAQQQKSEQEAKRTEHKKQAKQHKHQHIKNEMQDWRAFATMPKLEALCDAMEKLCTNTLPPLDTAEAVRELQAQWRSMKAPHTPEAQALWERFKEAGDRAWEPCAAHYEKEQQHRAFNLQQRQIICDALEQFANTQNWQTADWKAVARILEKSRKEFHDFHPVDRSEEKNIRTRFDAAFSAINHHLLNEQTANEARKQQLVNAAKSIAEMADVEKATERFQQIQEQWKTIGVTRHHEDQKLWQALQEHGKVIFDKRRTEQQQQRQAQDERVALAKSLCERIAALATLDDAALSQSAAMAEQLQSEFRAIKDLPEKLHSPIKKQFFAACDAYQQQVRGIAQRQRRLQMDELQRRAQLCAAVERDPSAIHIEQIDSQWQQHALPTEWERAIQARKQQAIAVAKEGVALDTAHNAQRLRAICVELEILFDVETPEVDRSFRRERQLQKLQQGLGQTSDRTAAVEQLLVDWYCTGSVESDVQHIYQARFEAALSRHKP